VLCCVLGILYDGKLTDFLISYLVHRIPGWCCFAGRFVKIDGVRKALGLMKSCLARHLLWLGVWARLVNVNGDRLNLVAFLRCRFTYPLYGPSRRAGWV